MSVRTMFLSVAVAASAAMLVGCEGSPDQNGNASSSYGNNSVANLNAPRTEGERVLAESRMLQQKGELMVKGEQLVAEGKSVKAKGQALQDQGRTVDAARLLGEGNAKIQEGQAMIDRANSMNTQVSAPRTAGQRESSNTSSDLSPSTQPSNP